MSQSKLSEQEKTERLGHISDVLLEHVLTFEEKIEEVADSFDQRIEEIVNERVDKRLKELGHA